MNNLSFQDLSNLLKIGHEIEFIYKGKNYSITNCQGFWNLCVEARTKSKLIETICPFGELDLLPDRLASIYIEGVRISQIFDDSLFESSSLQIL